jgi:CBS domain-containing protein
MALTIGELLVGRDRPISVRVTEPLGDAIELMARHDFTQLPVIGEQDKLVGVVSSDSILRAVEALGSMPAKLTVADAMTRPRSFDPDADVADLLNALRDHYAAIVVDGDEKLVGIVTGYDASEYFRRRSEDIMLVEDIETGIKDHIQAACRSPDGKLDEPKLRHAMSAVAKNDKQVRTPTAKALNLYLSQGKLAGPIDQALLNSVVDQSLEPSTKGFDDLALSQYIDLLLHQSIWDGYSDVFGIDADALRRLLSSVRQIRNALAHFRGEISATQRRKLRYCAEWLERHPPRQNAIASPVTTLTQPSPETGDEVNPLDDDIEPGEGRYAKLAVWLEKAAPSQEDLTLTFNQVEDIIGSSLPASSREHRSWWANDSVSHPWSKRWLEVGWRVSALSLTDERVTFSRNRDREAAYIEFFSKLDSRLAKTPAFPLRPSRASGLSWHTVARLPRNGPPLALLVCSFARGQRVRVECYLNANNRDRVKELFDALVEHRSEIEQRFGAELSWERLDSKTASRIAAYRKGSITGDRKHLESACEWAADALVRLHGALNDIFQRALTRQRL